MGNTVRESGIMPAGAKYRNFCHEMGVITWKQTKQKKSLLVQFGQRVTVSQQKRNKTKQNISLLSRALPPLPSFF